MDFAFSNPLSLFLYGGLFVTGFLLLLALMIRLTHGLFFSRTPKRFLEDQNDPRYDHERRAGLAFSHFVLCYLPPFFLGFLILSFLFL